MLGDGGMATVYRGRHSDEATARSQGGDVALKVLHAHLLRHSEAKSRFEAEAQLGRHLSHPGIVRVLDVFSQPGAVAFAMELVTGRSLSQVIGRETGPIPWVRAEAMIVQLLDVVQYLHEQGLVHRDIKPDNILVDSDGKLTLIDLGIAKNSGSGVTRTGLGMGTIDYMAPEQHADAKSVDARADIYALGMTLYEMLAGRLPWDLQLDELDIRVKKLEGALPPPTMFYPDIPPPVVDAVMTALARETGDRHPSVGDFRSALGLAVERGADIQVEEPPTAVEFEADELAPDPTGTPTSSAPSVPLGLPARRASARRNSWLFLSLVLVGLLIITGGGAYLYQAKRAVLEEVESANIKLETEISALRAPIDEDQGQREPIQQKLQVIGTMQANKTGPVHMLDELALRIPEKLWLTSFEQVEEKATIEGISINNEVIATFMSRLEESKYFTEVYLVSIQRAKSEQDLNLKDFRLTSVLTLPPGGDGGNYSYNALGKRDPYRSFISRMVTVEGDEGALGPLQLYEIDQYRLLGIIWNTGTPRALVEDPYESRHVVGIGTLIGKNWGKITQIKPEEIVITEEYRDPIENELIINEITMRLPDPGDDKTGE